MDLHVISQSIDSCILFEIANPTSNFLDGRLTGEIARGTISLFRDPFKDAQCPPQRELDDSLFE